MYCAKCGNQLKDGEAYCPKCGAKVGAKSMKTATLVCVIVALVVIIGLMVFANIKIMKRVVMGDVAEAVLAETTEIVETETEIETSASETQVSESTTAVPQTTKAAVVQTTKAIEQTTQPLVVSFTPPISGTIVAETQTQQIQTQVAAVVETEASTKKGTADGGPVVEDAENAGPGAYIAPTSAKSVVTDPEVVGSTIQEVKVKSTTKYTDSIEDDENNWTCKITIAKPNMQGKDQEETDALNESIEELMDVLIEEVESLIDDYDDLPKSISLTTATVTSTNKSSIFISLSGSITLRSGSSKTLKYRITYDREEQTSEYNKV